MDLNARVDVNCGRKDGRTDWRTENWTPISHLAKAGATKTITRHFLSVQRLFILLYRIIYCGTHVTLSEVLHLSSS